MLGQSVTGCYVRLGAIIISVTVDKNEGAVSFIFLGRGMDHIKSCRQAVCGSIVSHCRGGNDGTVAIKELLGYIVVAFYSGFDRSHFCHHRLLIVG